TFLPLVISIASAALLAWKERLTGFALGLTAVEQRSAIMLAILTFVVFPVLPTEAIDPLNLIIPRETWAIVVLVAALGFVNYILWRLYGTRGIELTGFLGGLVNSTVAVMELATRTREFGAAMIEIAFRGTLLATAAMLLRNSVLLGIVSPATL